MLACEELGAWASPEGRKPKCACTVLHYTKAERRAREGGGEIGDGTLHVALLSFACNCMFLLGISPTWQREPDENAPSDVSATVHPHLDQVT